MTRNDNFTIKDSELSGIWSMSKAFAVSRYDRLIWSSKKLHELHPEISANWAYKLMDSVTRIY